MEAVLRHNIGFLEENADFLLTKDRAFWVQIDHKTGRWVQLLHDDLTNPFFLGVQFHVPDRDFSTGTYLNSIFIRYQFNNAKNHRWIHRSKRLGACFSSTDSQVAALAFEEILNHSAKFLDKSPKKQLRDIISIEECRLIAKPKNLKPGLLPLPHPLTLFIKRTEKFLQDSRGCV